MVWAAASAGGGYAAFRYLGEVSGGERRSGGFAIVFWTMRAGSVGMSGWCIGSSFFSDFNELLDILVLQSRIVFGFNLCFLLVVGVLGVLEDIDEVFTSADHFPRLIDYRDRLHERHFGGLLLKYWLSKASFEGVYASLFYPFAGKCGEPWGISWVFCSKRNKSKTKQQERLCQQSSAIPMSLCVGGKEGGYKEGMADSRWGYRANLG
jgi:MFS family permease